MIAVPPTVYNLKNVTQREGASTTLVCLSYGDPAPTMSFRKTSNSEPYRMGDNVSICSAFMCVSACNCITTTYLLNS